MFATPKSLIAIGISAVAASQNYKGNDDMFAYGLRPGQQPNRGSGYKESDGSLPSKNNDIVDDQINQSSSSISSDYQDFVERGSQGSQTSEDREIFDVITKIRQERKFTKESSSDDAEVAESMATQMEFAHVSAEKQNLSFVTPKILKNSQGQDEVIYSIDHPSLKQGDYSAAKCIKFAKAVSDPVVKGTMTLDKALEKVQKNKLDNVNQVIEIALKNNLRSKMNKLEKIQPKFRDSFKSFFNSKTTKQKTKEFRQEEQLMRFKIQIPPAFNAWLGALGELQKYYPEKIDAIVNKAEKFLN